MDELLQQLQEVRTASRSITEKLSTLVANGTSNRVVDIQQLERLKGQLATTQLTCHDLNGILTDSAFTASSVAHKIRQVDLQRSRVKGALEYVENVIELKAAVHGMHNAIDTRDWDRAANFVSKARKLPPSLVNGDFAKAMVPTSELPDYPQKTIDSVSESLGALFLREFNAAAAAKDTEKLTAYFRLFPLIGHDDNGLDAYSKFICGIIVTQSRQILRSRPPSGNHVSFYAMALRRLFESIANIVSHHRPVIENHYPGGFHFVAEKIQDEADSQAGLIIDTLWDEQAIDRLVNEVKSYAYSYLVSSFTKSLSTVEAGGDVQVRRSEDEGVDLKAVGQMVGELSTIFTLWTVFEKFMVLQLTASTSHQNEQQEDDHAPILTRANFMLDSRFAKKLDVKVKPAFEDLITFVFRRSVEKAFQLEDMPMDYMVYSSETPLVTSVVDDVMFMFSTVIKQTVVTGDIDLIKGVLANVKRVLESDYLGVTQRRLREEAPKQGISKQTTIVIKKGKMATTNVHTISPEGLQLRHFIIHLNDLSLCSTYAERIVGETDVERDLPFDDDSEKTKEYLSSLGVQFRNRCQDLIGDGVQVLYAKYANLRVQVICNSLFRQYNNYIDAPTENFAGQFSAAWDSLMGDLQSICAPDIYSRLIAMVATAVAKLLEKWIWGLEGKVNELGAIHLDRDISKILGKVCEGRYNLRQKFSKVAQMVIIIGLEEESETDDVDWVLTEEEKERASRITVR